jgi:hypothetical protein
MISKAVLAAALYASAAFAQSAPVPQRVLTFAQGDSPQAVQEIVNTLRAIAGAPRVTQDFERKTITVQAPVAQAGLAEWLFNLLDVPAPSGGRPEYVLPGAADDVVRVLYPTDVADYRQLQELVNALRSIAEIQRVVAFTPQKSITVRGQAWQLDLADWLLKQLDTQPVGQTSAAYSITGVPPAYPSGIPFPTAVRVFYLPAGTTADAVQQAVNLIRTQAEVMRVVGYPARPAVAMRGTDAEATAAAGFLSGAK